MANCFISEITVAELKYGVAKSTQKEKNRIILEKFQTKFSILPIYPEKMMEDDLLGKLNW